MSKTDLLPRIESTGSGGIVLVDEHDVSDFSAGFSDRRSDLTTEPEDANGLPESLTDLIHSLLPVSSDYSPNHKTILRLIAEYGSANYSRGFRAGRLAERGERG